MILGVGIDLLNNERINNLYSKYNEKLLKRILSNSELEYIKLKNFNEEKIINFLGKRFSGKESFFKAVGVGIGRGINFNDISIINDGFGKPEIFLNEKSIAFLKKIFKVEFSMLKINVSLTDDKNFINSIVIISLI